MCCVSYRGNYDGYTEPRCTPWEYNGPVSRDSLDAIQAALNSADVWVFFNAKRELHWFRRTGIIDDFHVKQRIWCCQVAQFIISNQLERYPDLNSSCAAYGLPPKSSVVETEYWDRGIDTPSVPWDVLSEYAGRDADLTFRLYEAQQKYLRDKPELLRLIQLACADLLILCEMEFNGLIYDLEESARRQQQKQEEIAEIERELRSVVNISGINFGSPEHISCILYGGTVKWTESTPYEHTYKTGQKQGITETRYRHKDLEAKLPRLIEPLPKTALAKKDKDGKDILWSTDDGVLKRLKPKGIAKRVIELITRRNELERLASTYYQGFPKIHQEMDWEPNVLHGQFNQVTVVTGRLSSSKPNLQNVPPEVNELIKTRF